MGAGVCGEPLAGAVLTVAAGPDRIEMARGKEPTMTKPATSTSTAGELTAELEECPHAPHERLKGLIRGTIPGIRAVLLLSAPARNSTQAKAPATCAKTER